MPIKKRVYRKRKIAGKSVVSKVKRAINSLTIARPVFRKNTLFQDTKVVNASYCQIGTFNTSTVPNFHAFRLNNLWDPYASGVGVSCKNYATMAANYNKYRVLDAMVEVYMFSNDDMYGGIIAYDDSGAINSFTLEDYAVQDNASMKIRSAYADKPLYFKRNYHIAKLLSVSDVEYNSDDTYVNAFGVVGTETAFLSLFAQHADLATTASIRYMVKITYKVQLQDVKTLVM